MGSKSMRDQMMFQKFKEEAQIVKLKSSSSVKRAVKWRGKLFMTGSLVQVFKTVKNEIIL
jgi:hypothetical protein